MKPVATVRVVAVDAAQQEAVASELSQAGVLHSTRGVLVAEYHRNWTARGLPIASVALVDAARASEFHRFVAYLRHGVEGTSPPKSALLVTSPPSTQRYELAVVPQSHAPAAVLTLFAIGRTQPVAAPPPAAAAAGSSVRSSDSDAVLPPWGDFSRLETGDGGQLAGVKRPREQAPQQAAAVLARPATPPLPVHRPVTPPPAVAVRVEAEAAATAVVVKRPRPAAAPLPACDLVVTGSDEYVAPHGHEYVHATEVMKHESDRSIHAVIERITRMIVAGELPFPYRRYCMRPAAILAGFTALRSSDPLRLLRFETYKLHGYIDAGRRARVMCDGPMASDGSVSPDVQECLMSPSQLQHVMRMHAVLLPHDAELNETCCNLVDYFTEDARMDAVRKGEPAAPTSMWQRPEVAKSVVEKAVRKYHEITDFSLRQGMYGRVGTCNLFKPNLARSLYTLLGGTRILDMCAGWGCRLIGALACAGVQRYVACDPNRALVPGHARIMTTFAPASSAQCTVLCTPFETAELPAVDKEAGFNLALTSPPYFDLEVYESAQQSVEDGQSIASHPTLSSWLKDWYFPVLLRAWTLLNDGAHLALYINDHARDGEETLEICYPMLQYASTLPGCRWVGVIGVEGETQLVRPLWVWRKGALATPPPPLYARLREHELLLAAAAASVSVGSGSARYADNAELTALSIGVAPPPTVVASAPPPASDAASSGKRPVGLSFMRAQQRRL